MMKGVFAHIFKVIISNYAHQLKWKQVEMEKQNLGWKQRATKQLKKKALLCSVVRFNLFSSPHEKVLLLMCSPWQISLYLVGKTKLERVKLSRKTLWNRVCFASLYACVCVCSFIVIKYWSFLTLAFERLSYRVCEWLHRQF